MMMSSNCVADVARVVPQCIVGLVLLVTSMSYHVSSQVGSTPDLRKSTTSRSATYASLQPSGDVAAVTPSEWRPPVDTVRIKAASNVTVFSANRMNHSAIETSSSGLEHHRNNTSVTETTSQTGQLRQQVREDVVDGEQLPVRSDYASQTEDVYSYHDENWDGNQGGNAEDEEDGNHGDDDDGEVNDNEYLENQEDYYQENNSPADRATAFNYSSDYDDLVSRRLKSSGSLNTRSEPINMSLLVIYSWLGLVAVMIVCTIIIYKYKEPMNNVWRSFYLALCHRNRRSRGIEESNTLLTHPLV